MGKFSCGHFTPPPVNFVQNLQNIEVSFGPVFGLHQIVCIGEGRFGDYKCNYGDSGFARMTAVVGLNDGGCGVE
jgi:hypothetical protein